MPIIALSTCWNSPRHTDGYEMIAEIAALGFKHVELSHGIRVSLVPGILRALEEGLVEVTSTHNFCPLPPGVNSAAPNLFTPTSTDPRNVAQWERYTRRSIEFARQVGARAIVTHLGGVEMGWFNPARKVVAAMEARHGEGTRDDEKLHTLALAALVAVKKRKPRHWKQLFLKLQPILEEARSSGLVIAGENRERVEELPLEEDFPALLKHFGPDSGLAAWHDTGHGHLKARMGLIEHEDFLAMTADRLAGFHVHDVRGFKDHLPPGEGEIDFGMIARFIRPEHIVVLELNPRLNPTEVVAGAKYLEKIFAQA